LPLATSISGTRVFDILDTGAKDMDLNENFSEEFAVLLQNGTRQTRDITGLGGTTAVASITLPEVPFQIGPTHVVFGRRRNSATVGGTCSIGNIGRDVLAQTGEFVMDLSAMVLQLQ
jgi:hypothetical protein